MRLFIRAVNRPQTNVYSTLASLATRDPDGFCQIRHIHIVSGDGDRAFLQLLGRTRGLSLHFASDETYRIIRQWKPKRRGAWSYSYALMLACDAGSDAVLMEDDIEVTNRWHGHLKQAIERASALYTDGRFAISGYFGFPTCPFKASSESLHECAKPFWGNLFTFWPSHMLREIQPDFTSIVKRSEDMSTDLTVQHWLAGHSARLLYMHPSIVQHRGDTTTLRPDGVRRSPTYNDGFES